MNTKNIFRMLLVAAALLLGANNVKAEETQIWPTAGTTGNENLGNWQSFSLPTGTFNSAVNGEFIRFYATQGNLADWSALKLCNSSWGELWYEQGANTEGYYDIEVNQTLKDNLANGAVIQGYNNTVTKIVLYDGTLAYGENKVAVNLGQPGWGGSAKYFSNTKFKKAHVGNTVRIYGDFYDGWAAEFWAVSSDYNWVSVPISEWYIANEQKYQANGGNVTPQGGYIEFALTQANLDIIKGASQCLIQGQNINLKKIVIYVEGGSQPEQTINGSWTATSTVPAANATIKDDDALTIKTVYATTGGNDSRAIHGQQFNQFIKVRVSAAPSADNVTGTENSNSTPLTITAKRNTTVVFYYRRQADNGSTDWSFTSNNSKDLKLVDQSAPTTVINGTLSVNNAVYNDGVYGYVAKTYTLEAGKTYTVWATGTTIQLYGINYSTNASNVQVNTTYKITYYNGENVYCAIWLPSGTTIPSLDTDPSLEGYTFTGWKDANGNNLPSAMPAYDLTAYAQFSQNGQQEPSYIDVTMGDYEFRTYVTTNNIDISQSIGIKAYYASSANDSEVELTEITGIVASNVPLLLRKVSGATEYKLRIADTEGTTPSPNLLVAGQNNDVSGSNCYVLTFHSGLVFAEVNNESAYVDSEHAYLRVSSSSNARGRLKIKIGNDTAGINDIESNEQVAKVIYDLRGQRVERPTKGIYIINGKKTVIK